MTSIHRTQYREIQTPSTDLLQDGEPETVPNIQQKLQWSLSDQERAGGVTGWVARKLLSVGDWIEREVDERRQTIGGIDNLWLLLSDAADFNPVCACTYTLRGKITQEALLNATKRLEKKFPRYRQRLTSVGRKFHGARFEDDPNYDVLNHVHTISLPEPAGREELDDLMGKFIAQDWDLSKPLWEMILVENYCDDDGASSAIISRGHHTLADGQGFVISQLSMTSYHQDFLNIMSSTSRKIHTHKQNRLIPSRVHHSLRLLDPFANPASHVFIAPLIQLFLSSLFWTVYTASFTVSVFLSMIQGIIEATLFILTCWRVEMLTAPQSGPRVHEREYSSSRMVSMHDIRLCQEAFSGTAPGSAVKDMKNGGRSKVGHVTVNDVICSVMVDVLAEEAAAKPRDTSGWGYTKRVLNKVLPSPIGFFIPISVRTPGDFSMRNLSTGSMVYLTPSTFPPLYPETLHSHIHTTRSSFSLLKHSLLPRLLFHAIQVTGQMPFIIPIPFGLTEFNNMRNLIRRWGIEPLISFALQSFPAILTNVPGPAKKPIRFEGIEVIKWTAIPPQGGKGTLGIGLISYANRLCISIAADHVPGSEGVARRLCERFENWFEAYVKCAREVIECRRVD